MEDLYGILGVDPSATQAEINEAFTKQKKRMQAMMKGAQAEHDLETEEEAAQALQALFKANKVLGDPAQRAAYDEQLMAAVRNAQEAEAPVAEAVSEAPAAPVAIEKVTSPASVEKKEKKAFFAEPPVKREAHPLWIGVNKEGPIYLEPKIANRHGLIAGATGTGKTVTLKVFAENFSSIGVPVFLADIKGDVSGMAIAGVDSAGLEKRLHGKLGLPESYKVDFQSYPVRLWDVYGQKGHPVRTTISEMGPALISRLLELNETQSGVMNIVFRYADDNGLLLLDMKDLRSMLTYVSENADEVRTKYGNVTPQTIGSIQRALLHLEDEGGNIFFGEPALELEDWFAYDEKGRGMVNILDCTELFQHPILYSTFLLWMLSGLYDLLPECGDPEKPKMVFFFDEAHLIFKDAPKSLLSKVEQIVRLIRSKGVGVYFITQMPTDIPNSVLSQLGNKVQHALRAYTPADQKSLKSTAQSFRPNPKVNCEMALAELGTGEALISFLNDEGVPGMVQRAYVMPPQTSMDAILEDDDRNGIVKDSPLAGKYNETFDRESAYEILNGKKEESQKQAEIEAAVAQQEKEREAQRKAEEAAQKAADKEAKEKEREEARRQREEEREAARRAREEEAAERRRIREEEAEAKRLAREEEAARKAKEKEDAKAAKERQAMLKTGLSVLKSGTTNTILRGIFGMLKK